MNLYFLIGIFVTINIIQTWLILSIKSLNKGGLVIGLIEMVEFSLMIYLFLERELMIFLILVITEIVQWLSIAYFTTKG